MSIWLDPLNNLPQFLTSLLLIISSLGVITLKNPVHSSLSFLLTLLLLGSIYIQLGAEYIGIMQVLVYAGAILVIFMFVIILFQDAHVKLEKIKAKTNKYLIFASAIIFLAAIGFYIAHLFDDRVRIATIVEGFGTAHGLGKELYVNFFFPFEVVTFLFLVAIVGSLYIGKKPIGGSS